MLAPILITRADLEEVLHYQSTMPTGTVRIGFRIRFCVREGWIARLWYVMTCVRHCEKYNHWETRMAIPIDARPEQIRNQAG